MSAKPRRAIAGARNEWTPVVHLIGKPEMGIVGLARITAWTNDPYTRILPPRRAER